MIKLHKQKIRFACCLCALTLTGCSNFSKRMQANGPFDYTGSQLSSNYQTGDFTNHEARDIFSVPELTQAQSNIGSLTSDVDIRPPAQLIPLIEGVSLQTIQQSPSKVRFNVFKNDNDISATVWELLLGYLIEKNISIQSQDESTKTLQTDVFTHNQIFGSFLNKKEFSQEASFQFSLEEGINGHSVILNVELLTYIEMNDYKPLEFNYSKQSKSNIELHFINDLLNFAYKLDKINTLKEMDAKPLAIKLGFDDDHQIFWYVDLYF